MKRGWEIKTLGEIGKVSMCKRVFKNDTTSVGDIPFYKIGTFGKNPDAFITKELYNEFRNKFSFPKKGDILISASGTIGRRVRYDGEPAYFQDSNIVWIDNDEKLVLNDYLYRFYEICNWGASKGATISRLYNDNLKKIEIPFPKSLPEQQRIVAILDECFSVIERSRNNAEKNLQNARELFESYLEGVFVGSTGSPTGRDGWEVSKVFEIGVAQTGTTPKTAEKENYGDFIPFIKPADIDFSGIGDIRYDNEGLSEIGLKKGRKMESGSILMVCIGATIGKVGFAEREVSCNQQINSLTVKKEFEPKFFYYAMSSKEFQDRVLIEGKGAQATLPIINKSKWENLLICFPKSKKQQQSIVRQLDALRAETQKLEAVYQKKLEDLEELKKSILHKAFSGELSGGELAEVKNKKVSMQ